MSQVCALPRIFLHLSVLILAFHYDQGFPCFFLSVWAPQTDSDLTFLRVSFENYYLQNFSVFIYVKVHCASGAWVNWEGVQQRAVAAKFI